MNKWIVVGMVLLIIAILFVLYSCIKVANKADRKLEEFQKKESSSYKK